MRKGIGTEISEKPVRGGWEILLKLSHVWRRGLPEDLQ